MPKISVINSFLPGSDAVEVLKSILRSVFLLAFSERIPQGETCSAWDFELCKLKIAASLPGHCLN
jgi:hypothetical protein